MSRAVGLGLALTTIALIAIFAPISVADTVIESDKIELLEAGSFEDSNDWEITSKVAFSQNPAEHSIGMVADGELSFSHHRPDNFQTHTAWATYSVTNSNFSLSSPDGSYTWSTGPDITVSGYSFDTLEDKVLSNVSLILHISVPDALPSDEIRITIEANGPEKLVKTITRTFGPINRMSTPLVENIDGLQTWSWNDLGDASITVDYVSDGAPDDSEIRVDAVGIRVKYHQPWYSFETVKATTSIHGQNMPVIDFGPYDGFATSLVPETCGLTPLNNSEGVWEMTVEVPYDQLLGRIHVFGEGNFTIEATPQGETALEEWRTYSNGELLEYNNKTNFVRITLFDGCLSLVRIDINDPHLVVRGQISGSVGGLSQEYSKVRFAIGNNLINEIEINTGKFSFDVPIGYALPSNGNQLDFGIASRFQWTSNGLAESTVVHIEYVSIEGGYNLVWDRDVYCSTPATQELVEDEGGILIPMASRCEDDLTAWQDLEISVTTESNDVVTASILAGNIKIQPLPDASGEETIHIEVFDESGNVWTGSFLVLVQEIEDPPKISGLPVLTYVNLGESKVIDIDIRDPDSTDLTISTSRSWANIDSSGDLLLSPVEPGTHIVEISVSDGQFTDVQEIEVIVTAQPDLLIENIEIWKGSSQVESLDEGDVVQIKIYVRNQGRGIGNAIEVRCWIDDMLVGTANIEDIAPGGLSIATCDSQVITSGMISIRGMVDSIDTIEESNELNNEMVIFMQSQGREIVTDGNSQYRGPVIIMASIGLIGISVLALQFGPGRIRKPYQKQ